MFGSFFVVYAQVLQAHATIALIANGKMNSTLICLAIHSLISNSSPQQYGLRRVHLVVQSAPRGPKEYQILHSINRTVFCSYVGVATVDGFFSTPRTVSPSLFAFLWNFTVWSQYERRSSMVGSGCVALQMGNLEGKITNKVTVMCVYISSTSAG